MVWIKLQLETEFPITFFMVNDLRCFRMKTDVAQPVSFHVAFDWDFNMAISCESDSGRNWNDVSLDHVGEYDVAFMNLLQKI